MTDQLSPDQNSLTKKQRQELRRQEKLAARTATQRSHTMRRLLIWGAAIVGLGLIVWFLVWLANGQSLPLVTMDGTVAADDHVRGNAEAAVVVIEYSDFQCPACKAYEPMLDQMTEEFGDQVAFVYRHFPLTTVHANAQPAAYAAEAAAVQGKFWDMHDLLFDRQATWAGQRNAAETFADYATELGLDVDQFRTDYASREVRTKVSRHLASAVAAGLPGTPSIFINGALIDNPRDYAGLQGLVQSALATTGGN